MSFFFLHYQTNKFFFFLFSRQHSSDSKNFLPPPPTDSEKDFKLYDRARSECSCSEKYLDNLYLLASQSPKITDQSNYAKLKPVNRYKISNLNNGDYVQLKQTQRQVLLAITEDFNSDVLSVKKGDVVKMLACKEYEDKVWYFVRNEEGFESYIPSNIASEFL